MSNERMNRFQTALEKIIQKSKENQKDDAVFSLSITSLQAAVDNSDTEKALAMFEDCAEMYASMDEPDAWMGNRLSQLSGQLQRLVKLDDKTTEELQNELPDNMH